MSQSISTSLSKSKHVFDLNSAKRVSGTSHDFQVEIRVPASNTFDSCTLLECSIAKTWWAIDAGHSIFILSGDGGEQAAVSMHHGNYTLGNDGVNLLDELNVELNNASAVIATATGNAARVYVATVDPYTAQLLITYTTGMGDGLEDGFLEFVDDQLAIVLGFSGKGFYPWSVGNPVLKSNQTINLQPHTACYVHMDAVENSLLEAIPTGNSSFWSFIQYQNQSPVWTSRPLIRKVGNSIYRIQIVDYDGIAIDLHGGGVLVTLAFFESGTTTFSGVQLTG